MIPHTGCMRGRPPWRMMSKGVYGRAGGRLTVKLPRAKTVTAHTLVMKECGDVTGEEIRNNNDLSTGPLVCEMRGQNNGQDQQGCAK